MAHPQAPPTELPHVHPLTFYFAFGAKARRLVWVYYLALVAGLVGAVYYVHHPETHVVRYGVENEVFSELLPIAEATVGARTHDLLFPVFSSWPRFYPVGLTTPLWVLLAFGAFQALGWAGLLAFTSRLQSFWRYLVYAVFVIFLVTTEFSSLIAEKAWSRTVVSGLLAALFLVPAYLFQRRSWALSLPMQVVVFGLGFVGLYTAAYGAKGYTGVHQVATNPIPVLLLPWLIYCIHLSKDGVNLLVLLATNSRSKTRRLPLAGLIPVLFVWLGLCAYLFWLATGYRVTGPEVTLRPLYVLAALSLVSLITSQNYYHQLRDTLPSNLAFALLQLSGGVLAVGLIAFAAATGEQLLIVQTEWLFGVALGLVSLAFTGYLLGHFWYYLQARSNLFYVLMEPPRASAVTFVVVWFIALAGLVYLEGNERWGSFRVPLAVRFNQQADRARAMQDTATAHQFYLIANNYLASDPKSNFYLGQYAEVLPQYSDEAVGQFYRNAEALAPFPAARLAHARYWFEVSDTLKATQAALHQRSRWPDSRALHQAAAYQRMLGRIPDAVALQAEAARHVPNAPYLATTLAQQYWQVGQREAATEWLLYALRRIRPTDALALQQATFLECALVPPAYPSRLPRIVADNFVATDSSAQPDQGFTLAVAAYRQGNAAAVAALQPKNDPLLGRTDFLLLGLLKDFGTDSMALAQSRQALFLAGQPQFAGLASHVLAWGYFSKQQPEMAAVYYREAASRGWPDDSLRAAEMLADAGQLGDAALAFSELVERAVPQRAFAARRQLAFTLLALGQDSVANEVWDFAQASAQDLLRTARHALRYGNDERAVALYQGAVAIDSTSAAAYRQLAEDFRYLDPPQALRHARTGLRYHPTDPELLTRQYQLLVEGQSPAADSAYWRLPKPLRDNWAIALSQAEYRLFSGDTLAAAAAIDSLARLRQASPELLFSQLNLYWHQRRYDDGLARLNGFLRFNDQNAEVWRQYARFAQASGFTAYAQTGVERAIALSATEAEQNALRTEFAALLALPRAPEPEGEVLELRPED